MKGILKYLLIIISELIIFLSCVNRTIQLGPFQDNQSLSSDDNDIMISVYYLDKSIDFGFADEPYYSRDLFQDDEQYFRQTGIRLLKQLPYIEDTLIIKTIHDLSRGLGVLGTYERYRIGAEMSIIIQEGEVSDTLGLGWTSDCAIDSSIRGELYPCPQLYDLIVNYISENDSDWTSKQHSFKSSPKYEWEWLQKEAHSFCSSNYRPDNYDGDDNKADSLNIKICYLSKYEFEKDSWRDYTPSTIDSFIHKFQLDINHREVNIDEPLIATRIHQLLNLSCSLDQGDERFKKRVQTLLLFECNNHRDTIGIGEWPLDRIQTKKAGDLYPSVELFDIVYNYLSEKDSLWLKSVQNGPAFPWWDKYIRCDLNSRYGVEL